MQIIRCDSQYCEKGEASHFLRIQCPYASINLIRCAVGVFDALPPGMISALFFRKFRKGHPLDQRRNYFNFLSRDPLCANLFQIA